MRKMLLIAIAGLCVAGQANAATIVNGSFENGPDGGVYSTYLGGNTDVVGWTVGGHSIDYIRSYWQASDGNRSIDLAGSGIGSVSQIISTVAGTHYRVTFDVARNPDSGSNPRTGFVDVGGAQTLISFNNPASSRGNMGWETRTFDFVASGASTTLRFAADPATSAGFYGLALDNVSIASVPEPATWGMMILGFGLVGGAMRRRVRVACAAA